MVLPAASGGNGALSYRLTSEPAGLAGLSFDPATRTLSGTPSAVRRSVFTYRAEDADDNRTDSDAAVLSFAAADQAQSERRPTGAQRVLQGTLAATGMQALASAVDVIDGRFAHAASASASLAGHRVALADAAGRLGALGGGAHDGEWSARAPVPTVAELVSGSTFTVPLSHFTGR